MRGWVAQRFLLTNCVSHLNYPSCCGQRVPSVQEIVQNERRRSLTHTTEHVEGVTGTADLGRGYIALIHFEIRQS